MKTRRCKIILALLLTLGMSLTGINPTLPISAVQAAGEGSGEGNKENSVSDDILYYNDFNDADIKSLENEALAAAIFGEDNYSFGHAAKDAAMKIENGALRIIGDDNGAVTDGKTKVNRTQILLANNEKISERGVVIECDYVLNAGSTNAFTFLSKPIDTTFKYIDSKDIWISGMWAKGYRTSLRCTKNNNSWENPGRANTSDTTYSSTGVTYNLKLKVSPTDGMELSVKKASDSTYNTLQKLSVADIEKAGVTLADCLDNNVRLVVQCQCDVTIDNLKVSLIEYENLFSNDFSDTGLNNLENDTLAAAIFGEGNYLLGHAATDARMKIEDGALRIIGDDNVNPTDGTTKLNRTQILLAEDKSISKYGIMILCDYKVNAQAGAFEFLSKPIDFTGRNVESSNVWLSGLWLPKGYRTCLRGSSGAWEKPGKVNSSDGTYGAVGETYRMKVEVSPVNGITLSAKVSTSETYTVLQRLDLATITASGVSFANYLDNNVRMIVHCKSDITVDNLEVNLLHAHKYTSGGKCTECGAFQDDLGALYSASVSLDGDIGLNFYMELADEVVADSGAYVQFTLPDGNGKTRIEKAYVKDAVTRTVEEVTQYRFSCHVAAKEMADEVKLQLITTDSGEGAEFTYSVKAYAMAALANPNKSDEIKTLMKAMLNYGAKAQEYFSYNEEHLANDELDSADKVIAGLENYENYKYEIAGNLPEGMKLYSATLILESETTIKCRFTIAEDVDVSKLTLSDGWTTLVADGQYYYTKYENIAAKDLATAQVLEINNGTETWSLKYSALSYVQQVHANGSAAEMKKELTAALYDYYSAATTYFASKTN